MPWFWRPSRLDPDRPLQIPERDLDRLLASIGVMTFLMIDAAKDTEAQMLMTEAIREIWIQ